MKSPALAAINGILFQNSKRESQSKRRENAPFSAFNSPL
jgi:hypothetical protein